MRDEPKHKSHIACFAFDIVLSITVLPDTMPPWPLTKDGKYEPDHR